MLTRIAAALCAGFLLGIFYASLIPLTYTMLAATLVVSSVLFIASRIEKRSLFVALLLCASVLGAIRFEMSRIVRAPQLEVRVGEKVLLNGIVISEPDVRERSVRLTVDVEGIDGVATDARVLVIARPYTRVQYGDGIQAEGTLLKPERFESGEGRSFDYPGFLAVRGITHELSFADVVVIDHGGNLLKQAAIAIKSAYIDGLRAVLPEPYAGLAAGITAGDKRSVGNDLSDVFQRVSLVHILVLSGYNITIVLGALMGPLSRFSRSTRLFAVLLVVLFFAVISGGAASAVRAGAMAFCAVLASLYGRAFVALRVLTAIVFVMVLHNPYLLVFDPGFQLSVLATLGLILFATHAEHFLNFVPKRFSLREIAAATITTQFLVLPLLLYSNGQLSIVSLPANMLALIAVPAAMLFSAIAAVMGMLIGSWGTLLALPAYILLRYIVAVAESFASLPFASVSIPAFSAILLVPIYLAIVGAYVYLLRRERATAL